MGLLIIYGNFFLQFVHNFPALLLCKKYIIFSSLIWLISFKFLLHCEVLKF